MTLFNRNIAVTFGTAGDAKKVTQLHVEFNVVHQRKEPNTATVSIFNLASTTREKLATKDPNGLPLQILIEAGYGDELEQLYLGRIRNAISTRNGESWVTTIDSGDGEAEVQKAHVDVTFPKGAKVTDVLSQLIKKTGLGPGDLVSKIQQNGFSGTFDQFARGLAVSGNADNKIKQISQALGMTASVQDGVYTAFEEKAGGKATGFILTPETGLIGSPESGKEGTIKSRSLLLPKLRPGHLIGLKSAQFDGTYRVQKATHSGAWRGQEWYTELDLKSV